MNKYDTLTPGSKQVMNEQGTEAPFSGVYNTTDVDGTYLCRQCGLGLFCASHKFISQCGWPSFDNELPNAIRRLPDADGLRTEIRCQRCDGHLGHVFLNEGLTENNSRHCVNSLAIDFVPHIDILDSEEAIVAGGCFWGVQHLFNQLPGVLKTEVGYIGGTTDNPTYESVCAKNTGHLEAIRIIFNPSSISYQSIIQYFFEIHDPKQEDGQGPDIGSQYLSAIFTLDKRQHTTAQQVINNLTNIIGPIATQAHPASTFWPAEEYHQHYYQKTGKAPYCHIHNAINW